jgi:hypothetical protein
VDPSQATLDAGELLFRARHRRDIVVIAVAHSSG